MNSITTQNIAQAAAWLEAGKLVAIPTETVYGLGADAMNPNAVAQIYAAKHRPANHPLIVHLAQHARLRDWACRVPQSAEMLIEAFWPGPLTLVLERAQAVPMSVTGGQNTIALRSPAHPSAQALLQVFRNGQGGIAAPSANQFGRVSATTAAHVREEFPLGYHPTVYLLEGEPITLGIESTILDLSRLEQGIGPVLLRPGSITAEAIAEVIGVLPQAADAQAPRSPGALAAHYAPRTPLQLVSKEQLTTYLAVAQQKIALICTGPVATFPFAAHIEIAPATPEAYANSLYATLRRLDKQGFDLILVEQPGTTSAWDAINDRLQRAAFRFKQ
jgi:L-threonylcarbamoyladenylate synthase